MSFVPTATAVLNYWVRILGALEKKINRQSYETWLKPTRFSHISGRTLHVRIPSEEFQHIGDRYGDLIAEAIDNLGLEIDNVVFTEPPPDPNANRLREEFALFDSKVDVAQYGFRAVALRQAGHVHGHGVCHRVATATSPP